MQDEDDTWFDRLVEAIDASGRSKREISLAIGRGENYVQQTLKKRTNLGAGNLVKILAQLGTQSVTYVLTGMSMTAEDEEFMRAAAAIDPDLRDEAMRHFLYLKEREDRKEPPAESAG